MIGAKDDERVRRRTGRFERVEQQADLVIHMRDRAVVAAISPLEPLAVEVRPFAIAQREFLQRQRKLFHGVRTDRVRDRNLHAVIHRVVRRGDFVGRVRIPK